MKRITAILIDDEKSSLESLRIELEEYCPEVEVIGVTQNPLEGVKMIRDKKPNMIFLDIEMPAMNGFELLQTLSPFSFHVVFVTAYDQFAIKAFDFNAVDYLLKPVRRSKLEAAVQRVSERQTSNLNPSRLDALIQNLQIQIKSGLDKIALPTHDGFTMADINDVSHIQAESNYSWVFLISNKKHLVTRTLKDLDEMLQFPQYFRAHKSYLVNLNHVDRYIRGQGGFLIMMDRTQIPVARTQKAELLRKLKL